MLRHGTASRNFLFIRNGAVKPRGIDILRMPADKPDKQPNQHQQPGHQKSPEHGLSPRPGKDGQPSMLPQMLRNRFFHTVLQFL